MKDERTFNDILGDLKRRCEVVAVFSKAFDIYSSLYGQITYFSVTDEMYSHHKEEWHKDGLNWIKENLLTH